MGLFNTREVAVAIWLLFFIGWALGKSDIRKSLVAVLRSFFQVKVALPVFLMAFYTVATVAILATVGFWGVSLLKDTIVWFFFSAVAMMARFVTWREPQNIFREVVADSIRVVIFLEFLINTYTFPLIVELVLVPVLTFIAMLGTFTETSEKHRDVSKLIRGVQATIGFIILGLAVSGAIGDLQNLKSLDAFRSIALAPVLSVLLSPFLYAVVLMSYYEQVFLRLDLGREKGAKLNRYARRRIVWYAGLSLRRLQQLLRHHAADIMHFREEADVDRVLKEARGQQLP